MHTDLVSLCRAGSTALSRKRNPHTQPLYGASRRARGRRGADEAGRPRDRRPDGIHLQGAGEKDKTAPSNLKGDGRLKAKESALMRCCGPSGRNPRSPVSGILQKEVQTGAGASFLFTRAVYFSCTQTPTPLSSPGALALLAPPPPVPLVSTTTPVSKTLTKLSTAGASGVPGAAGVLTISDDISCSNASLRAREESLSQASAGAGVLTIWGGPVREACRAGDCSLADRL